MIAGYEIWKILIICVGVFLSGFVDAIGGGGGLISLPMYFIAGLPTHFALGTNKLSSCIGTTASTVRYLKKGYVDLKLAVPSAALAIIGSHFGTKLQLSLDADILKYILIVVLVAVAVVMIFKPELSETAGVIPPLRQAVIVLAASFVIGMYDGFYGPGSGTFFLLAFCKLAKLDLRTAAGNVKVVNLASNIGALVTSILAGKVIFVIGIIAGVFSFAGHFAGSDVMIKNGSKAVVPVIFTVLGLLFVKIVLELFGISF